jgi:hypothetical protein
MLAKLLNVNVTRRLFLRSPAMGAAFLAAPKPALPKARREIELVRTFVAGTAERVTPALPAPSSRRPAKPRRGAAGRHLPG